MPSLLTLMIHPSFSITRRPSISTLFPYTTLFRSLVMATAVQSLKEINERRWLQFEGDSGTSRLESIKNRICPILRQQMRSEEHTSELQSRQYLVCRLLLEKKKNARTLKWIPQTIT